MRPVLALWCLSAALAFAQEPATPPAARSTPAESSAEIEGLIKALGSDEFKERSAATDRLRSLGEAARPALSKIKDSGNAEQKTRAQALLQEFDEAKAEQEGAFRGQRLEPVRPGDPFGGGAPGIPGFERMPRLEDFPDPSAWMEAVRRHIESQQGRVFGGVPAPLRIGPGRGGSIRTFTLGGPGMTSSHSIQTKDERLEWTRRSGKGVSLKVEPFDPKTGLPGEARTYEASDLKSFQAQHPEIWEKYKSLGIFEDEDSPGTIVQLEPVLPDPVDEAPAGPRLGVVVVAVPDAVRAHVAVPERAVLVEDVAAGSAAEALGLRKHDILTHVDGAEVGAAEDIRAVLQAHPDRPKVLVRILRKGQPAELEGARQAGK